MPGNAKKRKRTQLSPAAAPSRSRNCCSVASTAAFGMLLTSPISIRSASEGWRCNLRAGRSLRVRTVHPSGPLSTRTGIRQRNPILCGRDRATAIRGSKRLLKIGDDVVDMLDADAEADRLRPHAGMRLLLARHLPMRGRGGMTGERLGVAHIDQ